MARALTVALLLLSCRALARTDEDVEDVEDVEWEEDEEELVPPAPPTDGSAAAHRIVELETRMADAERRAAHPVPVRLFGYVDLGFFAPLGNHGEGVRRDVGSAAFPDQGDVAWVFYGDLLATQINSRGDPADLGDLPGAERLDSINSNGAPTFLVNEVNVSLASALGPRVLLTASANLTPRSGHDFALGDWLDVDLAQLEWMPSETLSLFAGKVDSVLGHEYKSRKASQRFGITPTLVHRYTSGTAIGVKARAFLFDDHLRVAAAITNGSFGTEQYHFHDELDANAAKTASARIVSHVRLGSAEVELGASGQAGVQDGAPDGTGLMWIAGADLELTTTGFGLRAQWLAGHAPGDETARAYALELHGGGYVEATWLPHYALGLLARAEVRDADVRLGEERLYLTRSWRAVAGLRLVLSSSAVLKAEYVHNGEYDGVPEFANDVFTTSLVAAY